jgi:hypothetical protein
MNMEIEQINFNSETILLQGVALELSFEVILKQSYQTLISRGDGLQHERIVQDLADRYGISLKEVEKILNTNQGD